MLKNIQTMKEKTDSPKEGRHEKRLGRYINTHKTMSKDAQV